MAYFSAVWLHLLLAVFTADDTPCVSVKGIDRDFIEKANHGITDKARMLLELIFVRNGSLQVNLPCFDSDMQFLICQCSNRLETRRQITIHLLLQ